MQKFNIYSIFDVKAQTYGTPFTCINDALAARVIAQLVQFSGNPDYQRYPEDFSVFCIGSFVDDTGLVVADSPRLVFSLTSVMAQLRGAAVGGESPLKPQSANSHVSSVDAENSTPACDAEDNSSIKSTNEV